jgi:ADP-ribosyl-[dinitrogen reductase] hydrolase
MKPRTSDSHPLQIAFVETPGNGRIGMTFCPGKHDPIAKTGPWSRDMHTDIAAIAAWGATALVTLMESHELELLGVSGLGDIAVSQGMDWYHLPVRDVSVPSAMFEDQWADVGETLRTRLLDGQSIVVHCRGGLGRTGMVAARLLIELGDEPVLALQRVRAARPGAVETVEQEKYVLQDSTTCLTASIFNSSG